jgi:hypothetical protein
MEAFVTGVIVFILTLFGLPYIFAVLMPTWRWLLGLTLVVGSLLAAIWVQDWLVTSNPEYHEGVGGPLGRGFFLVITLGFVAGVVTRALAMVLASRGLRSRYVFAICLAGFPIALAIFTAPDAWRSWERRSPSVACLTATFKIKVANADFAIPAIPFFKVYLGNSPGKDDYYFEINSHLRAFCALSDNGRQQVKANLVWLRFGQYMNSPPAICSGAVFDWAKTYCAAYGAARGHRDDKVEFPEAIQVFASDKLLRGFGVSRSTYEDSLDAKPRSVASVFIKSDTVTPDDRPLTFQCIASGDSRWCETSYPWKDGANLHYSFRAGRDDVAEKGGRIDVETRKFLSGFEAKR